MGVEAVGQNVHKEKALANPFRIVGLNPTKTVAKQYLGDLQYQVVAYKESRFRQFGIDHDFPLQGGDPNDIGMMQVNNPTDDDQIWHWKRNADAGKRIFDQKYSLAQRYHVDLQNGTVYRDHPVMEGWYGSRENPTRYAATPLDDNQRVLDGFQRYNRGVFYRWIPNNPKKDPAGSGKWIAEPRNNYGNEAWDIYNGNLPSDWND